MMANGVAGRALVRLRGTCTSKAVITHLQKDGAVVVEKLLSQYSIARSLASLKRALDDGYSKHKTGDFFEAKTTRATGLLGLSSDYVHDQLMNPLLQQVATHFLTTKQQYKIAEDEEEEEYETPPQVSSCVAFQIDPGAKAQILHRDDIMWHNINPRIETWDESRDAKREASLSMFVAATPSTRDNGATRLILGSHLWGSEEMPEEKDTVHAELDPGDALFMLASVYHGGSANKTEDQKRIVFASAVTRGVLRQEENQFLAVPLETMKQYHVEVQKFAGFRQDFPGLGWVNFKNAIEG